MNALGFVEFEVNYRFLGKNRRTAFYLGFGAGSDTGDSGFIEDVAINLRDIYTAGETGAFNAVSLAQMFPDGSTLLPASILAHGGIGIEPIQMTFGGVLAGSRAPLEGGQLLPPQVSVSAYASRYLSLGRGAKMSFIGGFEADIVDGLWDDSIGSFWRRATDFFNSVPTVAAALSVTMAVNIMPVVVPRISYETEDGGVATRLPYMTNDVAVTHAVDVFIAGTATGSNNRAKLPLR